jgi:hypothetical protein
MVAMNKLVATAKRPEIEIAWPAIPSVALKSCAIGVNRLTGMNSEAINIATHSAIEPTALYICRSEIFGCLVVVAVRRSSVAGLLQTFSPLQLRPTGGTSKLLLPRIFSFMFSTSFCWT